MRRGRTSIAPRRTSPWWQDARLPSRRRVTFVIPPPHFDRSGVCTPLDYYGAAREDECRPSSQRRVVAVVSCGLSPHFDRCRRDGAARDQEVPPSAHRRLTFLSDHRPHPSVPTARPPHRPLTHSAAALRPRGHHRPLAHTTLRPRSENLFAVVRGAKTFTLFAPNEARRRRSRSCVFVFLVVVVVVDPPR
jgi:hypothetical protein